MSKRRLVTVIGNPRVNDVHMPRATININSGDWFGSQHDPYEPSLPPMPVEISTANNVERIDNGQ